MARGWCPATCRTFDGPGGELVLIFVDETYDIDGSYASALTAWKLGERLHDRLLRRGRRRNRVVVRPPGLVARRSSAAKAPREVEIVDDRATFGDVVVTLSEDEGPVQVETPDGVHERWAAAWQRLRNHEPFASG